MHKLTEDLLQFIWQHRLLKPIRLISVSGKEITILKPGELNTNAGPDFFNASIRINDIILNGNIELHVKTSDWLRHNHQNDKSYDTIILHAVYEHDTSLLQNTAHNVEVVELRSLIDEEVLKKYSGMISAQSQLACERQLEHINSLQFISWLERMTVERLEMKVERISRLFETFNHDYSQTFYTLLLRNFGFNVNSVPFELLAKQLPLNLLLKHADNLLQLEALLFGGSGMLEEHFQDKYMLRLQNEFSFLREKYQLIPLSKALFKFSRMRPANFPSLRLAQFAALVHKNSRLLLSPHLFTDSQELKKLLQITPDEYWKDHYRPDGGSSMKELSLGEASAENILINTFAPFLFFYSKRTGKPEYADAAIKFLEENKFENNAKTRLYGIRKKELTSAANSQGLINLHDNYCKPKLCLKCGVAAAILKTT
jgi:hypothetical protein